MQSWCEAQATIFQTLTCTPPSIPQQSSYAGLVGPTCSPLGHAGLSVVGPGMDGWPGRGTPANCRVYVDAERLRCCVEKLPISLLIGIFFRILC